MHAHPPPHTHILGNKPREINVGQGKRVSTMTPREDMGKSGKKGIKGISAQAFKRLKTVLAPINQTGNPYDSKPGLPPTLQWKRNKRGNSGTL